LLLRAVEFSDFGQKVGRNCNSPQPIRYLVNHLAANVGLPAVWFGAGDVKRVAFQKSGTCAEVAGFVTRESLFRRSVSAAFSQVGSPLPALAGAKG
jgi:hypothetical protein